METDTWGIAVGGTPSPRVQYFIRADTRTVSRLRQGASHAEAWTVAGGWARSLFVGTGPWPNWPNGRYVAIASLGREVSPTEAHMVRGWRWLRASRVAAYARAWTTTLRTTTRRGRGVTRRVRGW